MRKLRIPEFYANRCILITGASGFMGKVLLEKLLRSCPDLEKIFVIVRSKKNLSAAERWRETTQSMVFDRLKQERPGALESQVEVLEGDMTKLRLGLSDEDYAKLQSRVSVIFHVAASVRFNDPLPDAIIVNLRGTREVVELALGAKEIKVFIHVSTTFCNCYQTRTEERLYPPPANWREAINIAERLDRREAAILGPKYQGVFPNTYTLTKNLAESLIWDYRDRLPFVIMRPSIVIASVSEPIPGWIDNANGPIGLLLAAGKGIVRISYVNEDAVPDYMAADIAIKAILVAAWKRGLRAGVGDVEIYNMSSPDKSVNNNELIQIAMKMQEICPTSELVWYPSTRTTDNKIWYKVNAWFVHLLPAILIDTLLQALGKKPRLTIIQQRVHTAVLALGYFTTKHWDFPNDNFKSLMNEIPKDDLGDFDYNYKEVDPLTYFRRAVTVAKKVLLNEDEEATLEQALKTGRRMYWLDKIVGLTLKSFFVYLGARYFFW